MQLLNGLKLLPSYIVIYIQGQNSIVYRDLKTDNIAMYEQNNKFIPIIIDFGKSEFCSAAEKHSLSKESKQEYRIMQPQTYIPPDRQLMEL